MSQRFSTDDGCSSCTFLLSLPHSTLIQLRSGDYDSHSINCNTSRLWSSLKCFMFRSCFRPLLCMKTVTEVLETHINKLKFAPRTAENQLEGRGSQNFGCYSFLSTLLKVLNPSLSPPYSRESFLFVSGPHMLIASCLTQVVLSIIIHVKHVH